MFPTLSCSNYIQKPHSSNATVQRPANCRVPTVFDWWTGEFSQCSCKKNHVAIIKFPIRLNQGIMFAPFEYVWARAHWKNYTKINAKQQQYMFPWKPLVVSFGSERAAKAQGRWPPIKKGNKKGQRYPTNYINMEVTENELRHHSFKNISQVDSSGIQHAIYSFSMFFSRLE